MTCCWCTGSAAHAPAKDGARLAQGARQLLPPAIHAELPEAALGAGRLLVIGDVHGCLAELRALLWQLHFQQGNDTVVLVGDLVDKGPDSLGVRMHALVPSVQVLQPSL